MEHVGTAPFLSEDGCVYYKLRSVFSTSNETIYIPVDASSFVRPLIRDDKVPEYLELLSQMQPQVFTSRKSSELIAHYRDMLASRKMEDYLLLMKEIYAKQRELANHSKKLGQVDQQYLKLAERLICEEFAVVLDTTPDAVKKQLYAAMRRKAVPQKVAL